MANLLSQHDIKMPTEISDLLNELEQVDNVDISESISVDPADEQDQINDVSMN